MLGKTHTAVGVGTALLILQPQALPELLAGTAAAVIGSTISDIDASRSGSHKEMNRVIAITAAAVVGVALLDTLLHTGIAQRLMNHANLARVIIALLAFVGICAFGERQPHRSFMHSILAGILLTAVLGAILPMAAPYFALAFSSHLLLDSLNYKKVRFFYPVKGGFCLKICPADGLGNRILFGVGSVAALVGIVLALFRVVL